ncbi:MAG: hypothetical protein L3J52_06440 [Proteobacteria bacterium]|nr:hypothetical protein [Pseudomonadota bacterium]
MKIFCFLLMLLNCLSIVAQETPEKTVVNDENTSQLLASANRCHLSIQNKIKWDYEGRKKWAQQNLDKLCKNNNQTNQPGKCFNNIMHTHINWGSGTEWRWRYAIELCQGTLNATQTISCFENQIANKVSWKVAIDTCKI